MISEAQLKRIAELARLQLTEGELALYPKQFSSILEYFEKIAKIPTEKVEPLVTPTDMVQTLRGDEVKPWEHHNESLANAPERSGNLFKVPPVV
ncbi:MAG: Asp-tRNA(Asn)/Glu-tRNA(Gln) amidotransferase subunit GatC [Bdellovibrionales bacterium]|nr:Asp-tRNA(Asn)/Glu-tRNA(Gln) amidotransferase subunit GatC [Bdellovibrionales bacterium]